MFWKNTKYRVFLYFLWMIITMGTACNEGQVHIIPQPESITLSNSKFVLDEVEIVVKDASLEGVGQQLKDQFSRDFAIPSGPSGNSKPIHLEVTGEIDHEEGYTLSISDNEITIRGASPHGVFNGCQSLLQMIYSGSKKKDVYVLSACEIVDQPRFKWRGFMLDESRHFYGKKKIKQTLDLMALHKLNTFHWHLTDAPGWRIEIKKYPRLTEIGAIGNESDPTAAPAFYTQEDIEEIVAYAAERFIQIVPEIDMPGHASSAVLSYPELSGGGSERHPNFTFNPGKEEVYRFLTDVLTEVSALFPVPYIHIGGDEVSFGNQQWDTDPAIVQLKKANGLNDSKAVEHYFINRMYDTIVNLNKTFIGWDEIAHAKISNTQSVVMWWRHDKRELLDEVMEAQYKVILCPRIPMYLDFVQDSTHNFGRRWDGAFGDLEKAYAFPDGLNIDFSTNQVLGIQGNLWTDKISSENSYDFLTWPRLSAVAEAAWSGKEQKDFRRFKENLKHMYAIYDDFGLYYFDYFNPVHHAEPKGSGPARWQLNHSAD